MHLLSLHIVSFPRNFKIREMFNQFSQLLKIEMELLPKGGTTISFNWKNICAQSILVYKIFHGL